MEILKCEGIKKVYGSGANQVKALDGIDLVVNKGEFVAMHPAPANQLCYTFLATLINLPRGKLLSEKLIYLLRTRRRLRYSGVGRSG